MALCLAESLASQDGPDAVDQVARYREWQRAGIWSSTGSCVGISAATSRALASAQWSGNPFAGSHDPAHADAEPLARIGPAVAWFHASPGAAIEAAVNGARVTHQAPVTLDAVRLLAALLSGAFAGAGKDTLLSADFSPDPAAFDPGTLRPPLRELAAGAWRGRRPRRMLRGKFAAVAALESALSAFEGARQPGRDPRGRGVASGRCGDGHRDRRAGRGRVLRRAVPAGRNPRNARAGRRDRGARRPARRRRAARAGTLSPWRDCASSSWSTNAGAAGLARGRRRSGSGRVPDRVRRRELPARVGPRRAPDRHRRQPHGAACGDPGVGAAGLLQPARGIRRHRHLRPARRRLPRAAAPVVHRLQPARHDALARQGAVEADPRLPPHPDAALRRVPARRRDPHPEGAALPAVRQVGDRGRLARHLAGLGRRGRGAAHRADRVHPRAHAVGRAGRGIRGRPRALRRRARQRAHPHADALGVHLRRTQGGPLRASRRARPSGTVRTRSGTGSRAARPRTCPAGSPRSSTAWRGASTARCT